MSSKRSTVLLSISVCICAAAVALTQLFLLYRNTASVASTANTAEFSETLSNYFPQDTNIQLCQHIADGRSLEENTTCLVKPSEVIQSFAPLKIWSYSEQNWINPPEQFKDGNRTLISTNPDQAALQAPIIITCPWGCTLGYP